MDFEPDDLKQRLASFMSDSPYEERLVESALAYIERLELELDLAHGDMKEDRG